MDLYDAIVLGAGPAGLGAGLALARAGASAAVIEAAPEVGGLCRTRERDGFLYDLGGHILFVRDDARRAWLHELLGDDLVWVDRPVASVVDGRVVRGRYLDHRPNGAAPRPGDDAGTAFEYLRRMVGDEAANARMRPYLEKIDGVTLEQMPAARVDRLMHGQSAPDGFWFCRRGIGQLMRAMAEQIEANGGTVALGTRAQAIELGGPEIVVRVADGERAVTSPRLVVGVPPTLAANLASPPAPPAAIPDLPMRAVCLVYLAIDRERASREAWIQVDDPSVPFARLAEMKNWSPAMAPAERTVLCAECYCRATHDDPVWSLDDDELGRACAERLSDPLGLLDDPRAARVLEVVRIPRAYPSVTVDRVASAAGPWRFLMAQPGVVVAQGGAVIEAIEAGEAAAAAALAG